jgi:hypothetical protein
MDSASPLAPRSLRNTKTSTPFPGNADLIGFLVSQRLRVKLASGIGLARLEVTRLVPIRLFLSGQTFDPEATRLMGVAFETARAAVNRPGDLTDEMIARTIIELAKAGERNVERLCEAALNVPTGAVSAPNPPPLPALPPEPPGSSS